MAEKKVTYKEPASYFNADMKKAYAEAMKKKKEAEKKQKQSKK